MLNFVLLAVVGSPLVYSSDKGEWSVDTFYRVNDYVSHDGQFRCKLEHISNDQKIPGTAPRYWELVQA